MENYIKNLIGEGEHQQLDFKFAISDSKKIARSLVAFANTDGGRLLIGVKDNGVIAGVRSDEEVYMVETASLIFTRPEVPFEVNQHNIEGKTVVEVIVKPSSIKPHFAPDKEGNYKAYIRVKDENQLANKVMIKVWQRQSQEKGVYFKFTDTERAVLDYVEQFGKISFSKASRVARTSKSKTENILANFIAIGVLSPEFEGNKITYHLPTAGNFTF